MVAGHTEVLWCDTLSRSIHREEACFVASVPIHTTVITIICGAWKRQHGRKGRITRSVRHRVLQYSSYREPSDADR